MAVMTAEGEELFAKWDWIYRNELHRLQVEKNDPDFYKGWCIIDNYDFVPEIEDEVGLLVFGYDYGLPQYFDEQREYDSNLDKWYRDIHGNWFSLDMVESLCKQYYEDWPEKEDKTDYTEKLEKIWEILKLLPDNPGGKFWYDGSEILCKKESDAEAVADFIDALCGETVCHTGFYNPDEDERGGEVDDHTGYWYVDFD